MSTETITIESMSCEEQDLRLGRLTRELKETERLIVSLQSKLKIAWHEMISANDDVVPVVNQMKTDAKCMARAREAASKIPDRETIVDGLRDLEESLVRVVEIKKSIDDMVL